jgi:RNA polymerase sigma factor (sigma-70 family)
MSVNDEVGAEDVQCWRLAAIGDGQAFGELYGRHCDRLFNYALRRSGSWDQAQDVLSLTFLELWRRRGELHFDDDASLVACLFGITTNVLRNQYRAQRRHGEALARLRAQSLEPDLADHIADRLDAENQASRLLASTERLPRKEREALTLVAWAGLDYAQAAEALRVPIGTVKSRVARARRRLRQSSKSDGRAGSGAPIEVTPLGSPEVLP